MKNLNDFYFFHAVAVHQGFSAAARALGVQKSTVSKSVARLEDQLSVRLFDRTTRKIRLTDIGREVFDQSELILAGVDGAENIAARAHSEPRGLVRMSCPQGLLQNLVADVLPTFMDAHPDIRLQLKVINRRADLIDDGIDVALRARSTAEPDSSLVVRTLGRSQMVLAVSPTLLEQASESPTIDQLGLPTLSMREEGEQDSWELVGPEGIQQTISHRPRLMCSNFDMLHAAALDGIGIALLPEHICAPSFLDGRLLPLLRGWHSPVGDVQAVFLTRKGLVPAIRALIDHLAIEIRKKLQLASASD